VFTEALEREGKAEAWALARRVITFLVVILSEITVIGIVCITIYLHFMSSADRTCLVLELLRIMLSYALFICTTALSMAILNSFGHFVVPAATPVLLNLILIGAMVWICPHMGDTGEERIRGVAWAVFVAGILQLAVQLPVLVRYGYRPGLSFNWADSRLRKVLWLMAPAALGVEKVAQYDLDHVGQQHCHQGHAGKAEQAARERAHWLSPRETASVRIASASAPFFARATSHTP